MQHYTGRWADLLHARDAAVLDALAERESLSLEGIRGFGRHADLEGTIRRLLGQRRIQRVEIQHWSGDIRCEYALAEGSSR